jgi:hypothetical protein
VNSRFFVPVKKSGIFECLDRLSLHALLEQELGFESATSQEGNSSVPLIQMFSRTIPLLLIYVEPDQTEFV